MNENFINNVKKVINDHNIINMDYDSLIKFLASEHKELEIIYLKKLIINHFHLEKVVRMYCHLTNVRYNVWDVENVYKLCREIELEVDEKGGVPLLKNILDRASDIKQTYESWCCKTRNEYLRLYFNNQFPGSNSCMEDEFWKVLEIYQLLKKTEKYTGLAKLSNLKEIKEIRKEIKSKSTKGIEWLMANLDKNMSDTLSTYYNIYYSNQDPNKNNIENSQDFSHANQFWKWYSSLLNYTILGIDEQKKELAETTKFIANVFSDDASNFSTLEDLCKHLRKPLFESELQVVRNVDLVANESIGMKWKTSSKNVVKQDFENLSFLYEETLKIEDVEEYKKGVFKLFNELIRIHPFTDGNGRTSRAILSTMLISKNIIPPVFAPTRYIESNEEFAKFYVASDDALEGNFDKLNIYLNKLIIETRNKYDYKTEKVLNEDFNIKSV